MPLAQQLSLLKFFVLHIAGGTNYVRWGKSKCPDTSRLVYAGKIAGPYYTHGGGSDYICLHNDPDFLKTTPNFQTNHRGRLYGTEYEASSSPPAFADLFNHNAPCAVCSTRARRETMMIPGRTKCEQGYTREYYGYLMTQSTQYRRTVHICVDVDADSIPGSAANTNGNLLYFVEASCNGINCPPYNDGYEVTCVVCTR